MTLNEFLEKYCDGVKSEFARKFNKLPQNVNHIFKNDYERHRVELIGGRFCLVRLLGDGDEFITVDNKIYKLKAEIND